MGRPNGSAKLVPVFLKSNFDSNFEQCSETHPLAVLGESMTLLAMPAEVSGPQLSFGHRSAQCLRGSQLSVRQESSLRPVGKGDSIN